ncbi:MAG: hypothetical protein ABSH09_22470 [Bryobacteraceae bacterium]|jgi:hypothetical protein
MVRNWIRYQGWQFRAWASGQAQARSAPSFAGENRAYVEEVATGLQVAGVKVFYDAFEAANLWGKNLVDHLADIYANARYVVMFILRQKMPTSTHE